MRLINKVRDKQSVGHWLTLRIKVVCRRDCDRSVLFEEMWDERDMRGSGCVGFIFVVFVSKTESESMYDRVV